MFKDPLDRLKLIGFTLVGSWKLLNGEPAFELHQHAAAPNILYAFVVDGDLMYIGKSILSLRKRMASYKNPGKSQIRFIRLMRILFHGGRGF